MRAILSIISSNHKRIHGQNILLHSAYEANISCSTRVNRFSFDKLIRSFTFFFFPFRRMQLGLHFTALLLEIVSWREMTKLLKGNYLSAYVIYSLFDNIFREKKGCSGIYSQIKQCVAWEYIRILFTKFLCYLEDKKLPVLDYVLRKWW